MALTERARGSRQRSGPDRSSVLNTAQLAQLIRQSAAVLRDMPIVRNTIEQDATLGIALPAIPYACRLCYILIPVAKTPKSPQTTS